MSQRGGQRVTEFEERDYYPPPRRSNPRFDDGDLPRRVVTRSPPPPVRQRAEAREVDEIDVRVRERESERGPPAFLREDARRTEAGPMVLRKRDVETWDAHRRSPSPVRVREERIVRRPRSESPPHFHHPHHDRDNELDRSRTRIVERETERFRSPSVERRRSPSAVRFVERVERIQRKRTPSPPSETREHIHTRIIERERERAPSPSPSPSPPPVIRGPTIEREVITHYKDIDHGMNFNASLAVDQFFQGSLKLTSKKESFGYLVHPGRREYKSERQTSTYR